MMVAYPKGGSSARQSNFPIVLSEARSALRLVFIFGCRNNAAAPIGIRLEGHMRMYICTFPRMRTLMLFCAASVISLASLPSSAQSGRTNNSSAQAELHITAIVAPVIIPPRRDRHRDRDHDAVSYNLGPQEQKLSVTEEVRPMLVTVDGKAAERQPVRLTTVVVN